MPDHHYDNQKLAALYDLDSPWSEDREFYLNLAGSSPMRILDLGCGTGLLCDAYAAKGHEVTGVDPAPAMLDVAKKKPNGATIEWVLSSAQEFSSGSKYDLIIMTGHAFQVLLEDADIAAALHNMKRHLASGGRIVFESRNPSIDWQKSWDYEMELTVDGAAIIEKRRFISMIDGRMVFDLHYQFPDESLVSRSELRFLTRVEIGRHLEAAGLHPVAVLGDWNGAPFDEATSDEMIFVLEGQIE